MIFVFFSFFFSKQNEENKKKNKKAAQKALMDLEEARKVALESAGHQRNNNASYQGQEGKILQDLMKKWIHESCKSFYEWKNIKRQVL